MSAGDFPATGRLKAAFALIGVLALIVGLGAASAQAGGGSATTAKKCKKKSRSASVAKKKCKKKKPPVVLPAAPALPAKPPVVTPPPPEPEATDIDAVTLDWNEAEHADLDLHAWDFGGEHSGFEPPMTLADNIPGGTHSADAGGTGAQQESFADTMGSDHELTIGICYGDSTAMTPPDVEWTLTISYNNGDPDDVINSTAPLEFVVGSDTEVIDNGNPTSYHPTDICNGV